MTGDGEYREVFTRRGRVVGELVIPHDSYVLVQTEVNWRQWAWHRLKRRFVHRA